jgi:hypothetical protein
MLRRDVLRLTALAPFALPRRARAESERPEVWTGVPAEPDDPRAIVASALFGTTAQTFRLGRRLAVRPLRVAARTNSNERFTVVARARASDAMHYLGFDGAWWVETGSSVDHGAAEMFFDVDRADARAIARAWKLHAHERERLDTAIAFAWSIPQTGTPGAPIVISLRITNGGTERVVLHGGEFFITHPDGQPLRPSVRAGPVAITELRPNGHAERAIDIGPFLDRGRWVLDVLVTGALTRRLDLTGVDESSWWEIGARTRATIVVS